MSDRPPAHYVKANDTSRLPRCVVYFDTEAHRDKVPLGESQTFRCAVTAHDCMGRSGDRWHATDWRQWAHPSDLWEYITAKVHRRGRMVMVAHNLAYDLRVSAALIHLPRLGWEVDRIRLDPRGAWVRWKSERGTLTMVDSMSWLPVALEKLGPMVGTLKPELPALADDDAAWLARCEADVAILKASYGRVLAWLRETDMGSWQPTAAGMAWTALRHRYLTHRPLVHDDEERHGVEREAAWTGRAEAWRHGAWSEGPYTEWDFRCAYGQVMAEADLPFKPIQLAGPQTMAQYHRRRRSLACVAKCRVTTSEPLVPARVAGRIAWPIGTFDTTLCDPEIDLLIERGQGVELLDVRWYTRAPWARAFATAFLDYAGTDDGAGDPVIRLAAKQMLRAIVGRFGVRYSSWEDWAQAEEASILLSTWHDLDTGERGRMLQLGRALMREGAERDGHDALPIAMAWIMSELRARLWRVMVTAGLDELLHVDTDAVLVTPAGNDALSRAGVPGLRIKGAWWRVHVLGPRQVVLDGLTRIQGLPSRARMLSPGVFQHETWTTLPRSLTIGEPASVSVGLRTVNIAGTDRRRLHLANGATAPISAEAACTHSSLLPSTGSLAHGAMAPWQ